MLTVRVQAKSQEVPNGGVRHNCLNWGQQHISLADSTNISRVTEVKGVFTLPTHFGIHSTILSDLHPILVHFPLVLFISALFFDILSDIRSSAIVLRRVAWWLLTGAVLTTGLAIASGYVAKALVAHWPAALHKPIHDMTTDAWWTLGIGVTAWAVYGWSLRNSSPHWSARAISTTLLGTSVVGIVLTAQSGADMVFHGWLRTIIPSIPKTLQLSWSMSESLMVLAVVILIGLVAGIGWLRRRVS